MPALIITSEAGTLQGAPRRVRTRRLDRILAKAGVGEATPYFVQVDDLYYAKSEYRATFVNKDATVNVVLVLQGGGGGAAGKSIGSALALIALSVTAGPFGAGAAAALGLGGAGTLAAGAIGSLYVLGGGLLVNSLLAPKTYNNDAGKTYGVAGGGNLPKRNAPIPILYGRVWNSPDLAQRDFTEFDGRNPVLYKLLVIGHGTYDKHTIRLGNTTIWSADGGVSPAFPGVQIEWVEPGQISTLVPSGIITSSEVSNIELPPDQSFVGPFVSSPRDTNVTQIILDFVFPQGVPRRYSTRLIAEYASIDDNNNQVGVWNIGFDEVIQLSAASPSYYTRRVSVPAGRYQVRFRRANPVPAQGAGAVSWLQYRSMLPSVVARPDLTLLAMRIRGQEGQGASNYFNIEVEVTRRLRRWTGAAWGAPESTRNPAWAYADMLTADYGAALPDDRLDLAQIKFHADLWASRNDEFNGIIRGPVTAIEAARTILLAGRGQPLPVGNRWTIIRDGVKSVPRFVFAPTNIIKGSFSERLVPTPVEGLGNITLTYFAEGDPRRPQEVTVTAGHPLMRPKRMTIEGVTGYQQAWREAVTIANADLLRRRMATFRVGFDGRLIKRGDPCRVLSPMSDGLTVRQVTSSAFQTLTLDADIEVGPYQVVTLRDREGLEWGPVGVQQGVSAREIVLNAIDVSAVEALTGKILSSVLVTDNGNLPAALFGLLKPYVIVSARPISESEVEITAINDPPQVHAADGTPAPPEFVPPSQSGNSSTLVLASFAANVKLAGRAVVLDWAFSPVTNAVRYIVEISLDEGVTRHGLSDTAGVSGSATIEPLDAVIYARAVSALGIASNEVSRFVLASQFRAAIDQSTPPGELPYSALSTAVAASFARASAVTDILRENVALLESLQDLQKIIEGEGSKQIVRSVHDNLSSEIVRRDILQTTSTTALAATVETVRAELVGGRNGQASLSASVNQAAQAYVTPLNALAGTLTTLGVEISNARGGLADLSARITAAQNAYASPLGSLASSVTTIEARTNFGTANGQVGFVAESGIAGVSAAWRLLLSAGGAATGLLVATGGPYGSEVRVTAGRFSIDGPGGGPSFQVVAGQSPQIIIGSAAGSGGGSLTIYGN